LKFLGAANWPRALPASLEISGNWSRLALLVAALLRLAMSPALAQCTPPQLGAVREYERAAGLDATEPNYFAWGTELLLHGAAGPAVEVFGRGVRLHPDSARMLAGLGAALYTSGSAEEAAQRLCEASDLEPASAAPYFFLGQMQAGDPAPLPWVEQKLAHFAQDQPENALANYYYGVALWKRDQGSENSDILKRAQALLKKSSAIDP
jgi:tetratricopeptide (TPR) repeat protein